MNRIRWPRLGFQREVMILLPLAVLLLVLVSTFAVFTFRHSLELLVEARQGEAQQLARDLAETLSDEGEDLAEALERGSTVARRTAVIRQDGTVLASTGDFESSELLSPLANREPAHSVALGPGPRLPDVVAGFAPLVRRGERLIVRLDLGASQLAAQIRTGRVLAWVVLPVNALLTVFVLFFLRHFLTPYQRLLARARSLEAEPRSAQEDEITFLLETFERAMRALAASSESEADDISSLQKALGPSLESGVLLLDRQGKVLALNPLGVSILGLADSPIGQSVAAALAALPELVEILDEAVREQAGSQRLETTVQVAEEQRVLGLTVHALRRSDSTVRGFLVLFVDLTEVQREAEEERVSRTLEQLGELAAGIAHELRNGIATIRGYLTLIERRPEETPASEYLEEIRHESDRLERVLTDFLTFAMPGSLRGETVDLERIVRRAARDPMLADCDVRLRIDDSASRPITGDVQLLEQGIRNLLRNAVEAQQREEAPSAIEIRLRRGTDGIELIIDDRGPGLPDTVRERLFQPFVSGRAEGVGLGLSLTHRIASLHGGRLSLGDRAGGGTRAVLFLPFDTIVTKRNKTANTPGPPESSNDGP